MAYSTQSLLSFLQTREVMGYFSQESAWIELVDNAPRAVYLSYWLDAGEIKHESKKIVSTSHNSLYSCHFAVID